MNSTVAETRSTSGALPDPAVRLHAAGEPRQWSPAIIVAGVLLAAVGVWITRGTWLDIFRIAVRDEESSHIFLVGIAAPWLVAARWQAVKQCRPTQTWVGAVMAGLGAVLLVVGYDHRVDLFWHGGAVLVVVGGFLSFVGGQVLWRVLPAFFVLGFLLPVPGRVRGWVAMPLQNAMAAATEEIGQVLGMTIDRSGNVLIVAGQQIEVAEACNGMRMVFGLFLVAFTLAFALPLRAWVRALILVSAPLFALLSNLIRMIPTVLIYGYGDPVVAERFHDFAGWVMILVSFFLLMGLLRLLQWARLPMLQPQASSGGVVGNG